ncbi:glycosyltransferase family 4 protein [Dissulfurimicrobium hydrothermale]|uniref:glycosyltransferase family 4 protein n=1 Tax=Dissulfurimicrobium hydrothermale TaxID=1750598 RepID=UPI001EDB3630|nr:glycosyltransferase family 1 protein [Dissulfurimicrobium hydrothermale]UKL13854.1 glycosyltransferase family 4 protein [Dissulfurimicrobium hydrothermale]
MFESNRIYRIGVDARILSERITGIGRYTYEMLAVLVDRGHKWFLYSHRPLVVGDWSQSNVQLRTANLPEAINLPRRMLRLAWAQSVLPWWANQDDIDLFWAPGHRLPYYLPRRIARVVTIHDLVWKHAGETMRPFARWLDAKQMPAAVRIADRVITVSGHTAQDLVAEMPEAKNKVRVVHLGAPALHPTASRGSLKSIGIDRPYFLFVGTLEPRKNLYRLLEAYATLPEGIKNSILLVIAGGKGWGGVDAQAVSSRLGLNRSVHILGYVSDEMLSTLYAHALFLAMPSLYEGFGLPLLEAMARGTPVLTSNCSSMPEVAGDAGLLVDPHDVGSIAKGLLALLTDETLRRNLAQRAKVNAQRFSWQKAADATLQIFDEAIEERRRLF